jgi:hypothetical protein
MTLQERLENYISNHPLFDVNCVYENILQNHKKAIWKMQRRVSERIKHMLSNDERVFFITLTFDDEHLPKSQTEEIETYNLIIEYMLKSNATHFVANIDYGKENGRFHWHVVAQSKYDFSHIHWTQGAINFQRVPKNQVELKLSRYLIKLTRHAVKIVDPFMIYYPIRYKK